ncbi:MAG: Valine--tRNA ligase [Parcubacteria group bacterium ADurb.Bin305]|nr:MAG: Valine--tRNA ligase [Parcubacteria group bacterium ADurb.Bin305]
MKSLPKIYPFQATESKIYKLWEKSGYFNPDNLPPTPSGHRQDKFCIIMPPPNANDPLHIGHAVFITLEDLMIRYNRLRGKKTLWVPGTDHAGFETQVVFEKKLEKEGKNRFSMSREEFYNAVYKYTQKNKKIVRQQLKMMGASCDWSREKFTLDKDIINLVYETFAQLYHNDLIYRGQRIVNYCPKHKTALSDLEVKYETEEGKLYFIKYNFTNNSERYLEVATTRPETIPGDLALAVNPKDSRYQSIIGQTVIEPITERVIPVIKDKRVEIGFGTGVLKVTPSHDPVDFEIGQEHQLGQRPIIDLNGKFNELAGPLNGLSIKEGRAKVLTLLQDKNALIKEESYSHEVGHCYKCFSVIEPMVMDQWFVRMTTPYQNQKSLRDLAWDAVKQKQIKIIPAKFEKVFFHWLKNLKDWNISRQIFWGIRIPVYYCREQNNSACQQQKGIIVSAKKITKCPYCGSHDIIQDPDVLDTWFSSSQWPFVTLMSNQENDFEEFYPTQVMETGWDILFFWVARMIMMGIYRTGKIPFETVYLHGLVRDKDRQKMSKSKGNAIDPLGVSRLYGTDALRMSLIIGNSAGNDIIISEDKIKGYRNFANKIWNVSRFIDLNLQNFEPQNQIKLTSHDKKLLNDLVKIEKKVTGYLDNFQFSLAGETIYHYFWHTFADKIVEEAKIRIREKNNDQAAQYLLYSILKNCLILLHPFMPFVTETLWQRIIVPREPNKKNANLLLVANWPIE